MIRDRPRLIANLLNVDEKLSTGFEPNLSQQDQESSFGVRNMDVNKLMSKIDVGVKGQNELRQVDTSNRS